MTNRSKSVHLRTVNFVVEFRLLYARFDQLEFNWVYRNAKKAAYVLVRWSLSNSFPSYFGEGIGLLGRIVLA